MVDSIKKQSMKQLTNKLKHLHIQKLKVLESSLLICL